MFAVSCEIKGETLYRGFFLCAAEPCVAHRGTGSVLERAGVEGTQVLFSLRPQVALQRCVAVMSVLGSG